MREIIFRGKSKNDGEWICGGAVHQTDCYGDEVDRWFIIDGTETFDYDIGEPIRVISETIGQYTGLTDKNGKKIFEGDIVKCISSFDAKDMVVIFEAAEFHLVDCQRYKNYTECCGYRHFGTLETEVIGNIHDNPELVEGGK